MSAKVRIKAAEYVTHNVRRFDVDKPSGFTFEPGQATEVSIDKDGWRDEKRSFTFTALPEWDDLQFTIKIYPDHHGVTEQLGKLEVGDALILDEPWGTIQYKGPGTFIAGGAGITPFIAILRAPSNATASWRATALFSPTTPNATSSCARSSTRWTGSPGPML